MVKNAIKIFAGILLILCSFLSGCKSIVVGGSGQIGGVTGSGGVSIPLPKTK